MDGPDIPAVIDTYLHAHDRHDVDAALATFGPDASVVDEDTTYVGTARIREWLAHTASSGFTFTRTATGADDLGGGVHVVRNHLEGDFPGGVVDLRHRFELRDGLIHHLAIAP